MTARLLVWVCAIVAFAGVASACGDDGDETAETAAPVVTVPTAQFDQFGKRFEYPSNLSVQVVRGPDGSDPDEENGAVVLSSQGLLVRIDWLTILESDIAGLTGTEMSRDEFLDWALQEFSAASAGSQSEPVDLPDLDGQPVVAQINRVAPSETGAESADFLIAITYDGTQMHVFGVGRTAPALGGQLLSDMRALMSTFDG